MLGADWRTEVKKSFRYGEFVVALGALGAWRIDLCCPWRATFKSAMREWSEFYRDCGQPRLERRARAGTAHLRADHANAQRDLFEFLAVAMLAVEDEALAAKLAEFRKNQTEKVAAAELPELD
jgi:hypothetical protein